MTNPAAVPAPPAVMLVCDYSLRYLGGAQTAFLRQARSLADQGWTVVVVAPHAEVLEGRPGIIPVAPRVRGVMPGLGLPLLGGPERMQALLDPLIVRYDVQAIVTHAEFTLAAAALRAGAGRGIPVLHTVHTFFWRAPALFSPFAPGVRWFHRRLTGIPSEPRYTGSTPINNALRGMTLRVAVRADAVLSPSAHQAEALRAAGVTAARPFSNVSEPLHLQPAPDGGPLTLLWAARFAPEKRLEVALAAMRIVTDRLGPGRVRLQVAGGRGRAQADVTFHGRVPGERIAELVTASHAVLITSLGFDNQPMIALEAFTRGRPVVVTDPVLATEFGAAAIGTPTADAAGLAASQVAVASDPTMLADAGVHAVDYARARQPTAHARALLAVLADLDAASGAGHTRRTGLHHSL